MDDRKCLVPGFFLSLLAHFCAKYLPQKLWLPKSLDKYQVFGGHLWPLDLREGVEALLGHSSPTQRLGWFLLLFLGCLLLPTIIGLFVSHPVTGLTHTPTHRLQPTSFGSFVPCPPSPIHQLNLRFGFDLSAWGQI